MPGPLLGWAFVWLSSAIACKATRGEEGKETEGLNSTQLNRRRLSLVVGVGVRSIDPSQAADYAHSLAARKRQPLCTKSSKRSQVSPCNKKKAESLCGRYILRQLHTCIPKSTAFETVFTNMFLRTTPWRAEHVVPVPLRSSCYGAGERPDRFKKKNIKPNKKQSLPRHKPKNIKGAESAEKKKKKRAPTHLSALQRPDLQRPLLLVVRVVGGQRPFERRRCSRGVAAGRPDRLELVSRRQSVFHISVPANKRHGAVFAI